MLGTTTALEYIQLLRDEYIDFDALRMLDKEDLSELGIKKGAALKIMAAASKA